MAHPERQLRINAVELLRQPGTSRHLLFDIPAEVAGVTHPAVDGPITVDVTLDVLNNGIAVRGSLGVPWHGECRRGLVPLSGVDLVEVDELYQIEAIDSEAFLIEGGQLDLYPMVRELSLLALDDERLCAEPCVGQCPTLGVDGAGADPEPRDHRWAALDDVILDD
jgi:uncharacterized protein